MKEFFKKTAFLKESYLTIIERAGHDLMWDQDYSKIIAEDTAAWISDLVSASPPTAPAQQGSSAKNRLINDCC